MLSCSSLDDDVTAPRGGGLFCTNFDIAMNAATNTGMLIGNHTACMESD